jgi:hypothetical protein
VIKFLLEPLQLEATAKQFAGVFNSASSGQAGDLPFNERQFQATNAGGLSGAEYIRRRSPLEIVHLHKTVPEPATQQAGEFGVRNKMESAGEVITRNILQIISARQRNLLQDAIAGGSHRPAIRDEPNP